jgi:ribosomal protein S18 acetylase RimI-like enzyme
MSLYGNYIKEREDKDIVESDKGFATFLVLNNGECYLQDLYVVPEYRKSGLAIDMTNEVVRIAKERGCNRLVGSVCVDDKFATHNMRIFLKYGMEIYKNSGTIIFLKKEIL